MKRKSSKRRAPDLRLWHSEGIRISGVLALQNTVLNQMLMFEEAVRHANS
jgi:hypothetical protein